MCLSISEDAPGTASFFYQYPLESHLCFSWAPRQTQIGYAHTIYSLGCSPLATTPLCDLFFFCFCDPTHHGAWRSRRSGAMASVVWTSTLSHAWGVGRRALDRLGGGEKPSADDRNKYARDVTHPRAPYRTRARELCLPDRRLGWKS